MWSAITNIIIIILCYDLRSGEFSAVCKDKNLKNVMPKMHIIPQFRTTLKSREMLNTQQSADGVNQSQDQKPTQCVTKWYLEKRFLRYFDYRYDTYWCDDIYSNLLLA